jgi:hypothetical protein
MARERDAAVKKRRRARRGLRFRVSGFGRRVKRC